MLMGPLWMTSLKVVWGNDALLGGAGDDTYVYNLGDGRDQIIDTRNNGNNDKLLFGNGITTSDVGFVRSLWEPNDVYVDLEEGAWVQLDDIFSTANSGVDAIEYADGTLQTVDDIRNVIRANWSD